MSNYAPNYTGQMKVRYHSGGFEHTFTIRQGRGFGAVPNYTMTNLFHNFMNRIRQFLPTNFSVLGADFIPPDERIARPMDYQDFNVSGSGTPPSGDAWKANALGFVGKTAGGNRAALYFIGVTPSGAYPMFNNYRITAEEWTELGIAINDLNACGIVGADNSIVTWLPYVNFKAMDYWVKKLR